MDERERFEDIVDAICAWHEEARASKVFSMPCVKRSGKVVFGLSRTGMVFKLTDPDVHRRALALPGAHLFDPSGRGEAFRKIYRRAGDGSVSFPHGVTAQLLALASAPEPTEWIDLTNEQACAWEGFVKPFFNERVVRRHFRAGSHAP
jgi:hypothetical protein